MHALMMAAAHKDVHAQRVSRATRSACSCTTMSTCHALSAQCIHSFQRARANGQCTSQWMRRHVLSGAPTGQPCLLRMLARLGCKMQRRMKYDTAAACKGLRYSVVASATTSVSIRHCPAQQHQQPETPSCMRQQAGWWAQQEGSMQAAMLPNHERLYRPPTAPLWLDGTATQRACAMHAAKHPARPPPTSRIAAAIDHLYRLYCGMYMARCAVSTRLCGLGSAVANPPSYAFCATARATLADTSLHRAQSTEHMHCHSRTQPGQTRPGQAPSNQR